MIKKRNEDLQKNKYPKCLRKKQHSEQVLNLVCLGYTCRNKGIICSMCKTSEHYNHNVIPLKMFLIKIQQILNKKKNQGIAEQEDNKNKSKIYQQILQKVQKTHSQSLGTLRYYVESIAQQIRKCQQHIYQQYQIAKQSIIDEFNKISTMKQILNECINKDPQSQAHLSISISKLLSMVRVQKNQYQILSDHDQKLKKYFQVSQYFKKNIEAVSQDVIGLLVDVFQPKINPRPSTAFSDLFSPNIKPNNIINLKPTFSTVYKPKSILLAQQNRVARQANQNQGKLIFVNQKVGEKKQSITIKIIAMGANIAIGLGLRELVKSKNYKLNQVTLGHGTFMIGSNAYLYSHNDNKQNMVMKGISFKVGDQIQVDLDNDIVSFKKKNENKTIALNLKLLKEDQWAQLCFCVCLNSNNDKVCIMG